MNKTLLAYVVLGVVFLFLLGSVAILQARLDAEKNAHNATRTAYTRDTTLFLQSQCAANATISGLQNQLSATQAARAVSRAVEADRTAIFTNMATREAKPDEVVDDETNRKTVQHINNAFVRAGGGL